MFMFQEREREEDEEDAARAGVTVVSYLFAHLLAFVDLN